MQRFLFGFRFSETTTHASHLPVAIPSNKDNTRIGFRRDGLGIEGAGKI